MSGQGAKKRLTELDGLRGVAALAVVFFHYTVVFPRFYPDALPAPVTFDYGHFGVHLFFMISGFVILMSLERQGATRDFIFSRIIRLYPVYWLAVCLTFFTLAAFPLPGQGQTLFQFFVNLTMLQDYAKVDPVDGVYWSLTYELGFYAYLFAVVRAGLSKRIDLIAALMIVGALTFKWTMPIIPHPLHYIFLINAYGHLFAAGILMYRCHNDGWTPVRGALLGLVVIAQFIEPAVHFGDRGVEGAIVIAMWLAIFIAAIRSDFLSVLGSPIFVFFGRISYPLYLVHQMIGFVVMMHLQRAGAGWWGSVIGAIVFAIALSTAMTLFFDEPVRRGLKRRLTALAATAT